MRALWNRFMIVWCRTFHPEPSWPFHGRYYCPSCLRVYPVPWQEGDDYLLREASKSGAEHGHRGFVVFAFQKNRS